MLDAACKRSWNPVAVLMSARIHGSNQNLYNLVIKNSIRTVAAQPTQRQTIEQLDDAAGSNVTG
jgi:hypothetical protein